MQTAIDLLITLESTLSRVRVTDGCNKCFQAAGCKRLSCAVLAPKYNLRLGTRQGLEWSDTATRDGHKSVNAYHLPVCLDTWLVKDRWQ
jgi:hypothetical protein